MGVPIIPTIMFIGLSSVFFTLLLNQPTPEFELQLFATPEEQIDDVNQCASVMIFNKLLFTNPVKGVFEPFRCSFVLVANLFQNTPLEFIGDVLNLLGVFIDSISQFLSFNIPGAPLWIKVIVLTPIWSIIAVYIVSVIRGQSSGV